MVTDIGPSTVDLVAVRDSTRYPFQRKGFYAQGYHFEFYYASNAIYWRKSADGITWGSANDITPAGETPTDGCEIAVWLDRHEEPAHHPYVVYADHDTDSPLYFRRATIAPNGDLTWDAAWQEAVGQNSGISYRNPTICVDDTNGYPFIGYTETIRSDPGTGSPPKITHSQQMDGTWSTFAGFPKTLNATNDESWVCVVVPYNGVYVMAIYVRDSNEFKYDIYDITGDSWAGEAGAGVVIGADATKLSITSQRAGKVTAHDPRRVHIAFCFTDDNLNHISIDDGGVTGPTLIYSSATAMGPSISTRIYGGDVNPFRTLYVFWSPFNQDEPAADTVCYKKSIDAGANWTKEDGSVGVEQWANETGDGLSGTNIVSSYFEEQHHTSKPEGYIGVLYTNKGASPDYVRWAGLKFADPDEDLLCHAIIRLDGAVELFGRFEAQTTRDLLGKFVAQDKAELLGKVGVTHSVELLGKVGITHSVELFGKFVVGQDSQELFGKFDAGQNFEDLLGKFVSQALQELLGKFAAQVTRDLLGKVTITHSVELLGKFAAQTTQELFGKFVVGQGSQELLGLFESQATQELFGKFVVGQDSEELLGEFAAQATRDLFGKAGITHSVELLGKVSITHSVTLKGEFRMSTDDWIIQGVSVEAYIARGIVL